MQNQIDHAAYQRKIKDYSIEMLRWVIKDCQEALQRMPDSPKAGYYQDEINYCGMELAKKERLQRLRPAMVREYWRKLEEPF